MRLQKYLARCGVASRRACEALICEGRVAVNGQVVTELGTKVDELRDEVSVDGNAVALPDAQVTIMLNKPKGFVTTMSDTHGRHTVAELVPLEEYPGLFPVGRLDQDTTGLLLFTTDGELGNALLHPSRHIDKRYIADVAGTPTAPELDRLRDGIQLEDGMTAPAKVELLSKGRTSKVAITIHEGRKRQVKRMMEAVGHPVRALHRDSFGGLGLDGLGEGEWRIVSPDDVRRLIS